MRFTLRLFVPIATIASAGTAVATTPDQAAGALVRRADDVWKAGDLDWTTRLLQSALRKAPDHPSAHDALCRVLVLTARAAAACATVHPSPRMRSIRTARLIGVVRAKLCVFFPGEQQGLMNNVLRRHS